MIIVSGDGDGGAHGGVPGGLEQTNRDSLHHCALHPHAPFLTPRPCIQEGHHFSCDEDARFRNQPSPLLLRPWRRRPHSPPTTTIIHSPESRSPVFTPLLQIWAEVVRPRNRGATEDSKSYEHSLKLELYRA